MTPSKTFKWIMIGAVAAIVALVILFALSAWAGGITPHRMFLFEVFGAFFPPLVFWGVVSGSGAVVDGRHAGWHVKLGGPFAAYVISLCALHNYAPVSPRVIGVYLVGQSTQEVEHFVVRYRTQHGPEEIPGKKGYATAPNLSWENDSMEVLAIESFGFLPLRQRDGKTPPWVYSITNERVTIEMVKVEPMEDPFPAAADVREFMKHAGITEMKARSTGKFMKDMVSLTVENDSDRRIAFVAYDCVAALDKTMNEVNVDGGFEYIDRRDIEPGGEWTCGNFNEFRNPSGWFAMFVRYDDERLNRVVQLPLGCYNIFQLRDPRIVLARSADPGVGFRIDEQKSRLGGSR